MGKKGKKRKERQSAKGADRSGRGNAPQARCISLHSGDEGFSGAKGAIRGADAQEANLSDFSQGGETSPGVPTALARILRPQAAQRWTLPAVQNMTPQYVEQILRGALAGAHVQQWELFDLMLDTWPELAACHAELKEGVLSRKLVFAAYAAEGEAPTAKATEKLKVCSTALRGMRPEAAADENDLDDTLSDILDGWFRGVVNLETDWHTMHAGSLGKILAPRATFWAHPRHFAWGDDGRLGLLTGGRIAPLPDHKFLVAIHKAKSGSALGGAMLRPLAWWWCAMNFASDWCLNLAQLFGLPFRWANYDPNAPQETVDAICNMLQNMGSAGWAAFPAGTTLELKHESTSADKSPQGDLLDRADRYARMVILGQTLSGSSDSSKGGGKAFGAVEENVKDQRIEAAARFATKVLSGQLMTSITELNFGDCDECPTCDLITEEEAGSDQATRDKTLSEMMELPVPWLRAKYGVPEPQAGEEVTGRKTEDSETEDRREEDIKDQISDLKAKMASIMAKGGYDPNQPRNPAGTEGGGRWTAGGGGGGNLAEIDRKYLAAVESGDDEALKELVMDAAKDAGFDLAHRGADPETSRDIVLFSEIDESHDAIQSYGENLYFAKSSDLGDAGNPGEGFDSWLKENYPDYNINPTDIVDSAEAWDDRQFVSDVWQAGAENGSWLNESGYSTNDGAVLFPGAGVSVSGNNIERDAGGKVIPLSERFKRNTSISTKLAALMKINNDAVFAKALNDLANEL